MNATSRNLLVLQGYTESDVCTCANIGLLARWTPFACALFGAIGLLTQSSYYMLALGLLTLIGAFTRRSFYDHIYLLLIKPLANLGDMPRHGNPRRFGCGIGAGLYVLSGLGMLNGNALLTYIPSVMIIGLALVAATTQWCFASTLYALLFGPKKQA
jgi:hypothetical protein